MAGLDTISQEVRERAEKIGKVDLAVALPSCHSSDLLNSALAGLRPLLPGLLPNGKAAVLYPDTAIPAMPDGDPDDSESPCQLIPCPLPQVERYHGQSLEQGLRPLLQIGSLLGVRACIMIGSEATPETPDTLSRLAEPVLNLGYDLAVPLYARRKFDGLINSGIAYPLTRATYGARLRYPMAADLAISARLADRYLPASTTVNVPFGWPATNAICAGLQVCQVHRDFAPAPSVPDSRDLSESLAQVLSSLFLDMERHASFWQKVRGSQPVRTLGKPRDVDDASANVDVHKMIETFQRGCRDLMDIWAVALTPGTLVELRKLAKFPLEQFRLVDDLWTHVLYDFVLAHRQRVISREHLLRAMTPIYLGWVASFALEVQNLAPGAVEDRLETLCAAFESLKPHLVSRWRWPDRFNP